MLQIPSKYENTTAVELKDEYINNNLMTPYIALLEQRYGQQLSEVSGLPMVDRRLFKVSGINLFHVRRENRLKRCDVIKRMAYSQNRKLQQQQDLKCNDHPARKRAKGGLNPFMKSILPSILPQSLPWNENEIRLVDTTPIRTLSKWSWQVVEKEIVVGHDMFLQGKRDRNEDVTPYVVKCMYYCEDMMCGVIEVASIGDVVKFRDDVIPFLQLTIRITGLLRTDKSFPVVTMFASQFSDIFRQNASWRC